MGERDGDGSGAGADVENLELRGGVELAENGFDEEFRFGAGNEDGRRDMERERIELLLAGNVLDGLVGEAAKDEALVVGLLVEGEDAAGVGMQRGAGDAQHVQQQQQRVAVRAVAQAGRCVELRSGSRERFAKGGKGSCQRSVSNGQLLCGLDADDVAVGVGDRDHLDVDGSVPGVGVARVGALECDLLAGKLRGRLVEVGGFEKDAGLRAERGAGDDLNLLARGAGKVKPVGVDLRLGEAELREVEHLRGGGILHGQRDHGHLVRNAVRAQVLAEVEGVPGAGHVLRVLDVLRADADGLLRALLGEQQVACGGLAHGDRRQALGDVVIVQRVQVRALEAQVHEADLGVAGGDRVELEELAVVQLDEGLGDGAVGAGIGEGLVEAELVVEVERGGDVLDPDRDVGDAVHWRESRGRRGSSSGRRSRRSLRRGKAGEARGQREQSETAERGAWGWNPPR